MPKILVIEDDLRLADILRRGLEAEKFEVLLCHDGITGRNMALQQKPDLVVSDILLPEEDGFTLCGSIKKKQPDLPVILLTALGTTDHKVEGFDAGADDYMVKPFEMRELVARIRALLRRLSDRSLTSGVLRCGDLEVDIASKKAIRGGAHIKLSPKEFKLLTYLLRHQGRVISRTELAENVWDTHFDTGTNYIDVYINYLRKKIDKDFDMKLIHTRPGMGFVLSAED